MRQRERGREREKRGHKNYFMGTKVMAGGGVVRGVKINLQLKHEEEIRKYIILQMSIVIYQIIYSPSASLHSARIWEYRKIPISVVQFSLEREREMASWNSVTLEVLSSVLGWIAFAAWSISFYPQIILNFRRKRSPNSLSLSDSQHFSLL